MVLLFFIVVVFIHFYVRLLSTSQGSILDDEALVNALQSSKKTSEEVKEQLQVAEQTEAKIDAARGVSALLFHSLALYFLLLWQLVYLLLLLALYIFIIGLTNTVERN